ncbi:biotin--[acetyl-CoA-carboxylase] ligase [Nocardioides mesophilus]|uniref:biotin--[biotin carboxyl-carrier protein] ligase n=1 Tax=Nocardioides mesophilus TaxID=433659 RepID=A0A7G9RGV5_9ACTN|nr:biotin--[acetyl-CoA-carboxylase] ligase [Nocardioides mesophilus]
MGERPPLDRSLLAAATAAAPGSRWRVEVVAESPSTNAEVAARARAGEPEGLVLVAEHQTAGRGRLDRTWVTPARSALTCSVLLAPAEVPAARWPWLPLLTGLAVVEAVRRTTGLEAALKWPNDVLVGDAKVAGILVERVERDAGGAAAVVGVGLNVSLRSAELPVPTATSLATALGAEVDRTRLLVHLLDTLGEQYDAWRRSAGDAADGLRPAYLSACDTVGRRVRVDLPTGERLEGRAAGVDADGRLQVTTAAGPRVLGAGDVVHVRRTEP